MQFLLIFFQFSFFEVKMINNCEGYVNFQDIGHQLQENILHYYYHYSLLKPSLN